VKRIVQAVIGVLALAACDERASRESNEKPKEPALDETATTLPPGVREAWLQAVDSALEERIAGYRGRIRIEGPLEMGFSYLPAQLLTASCDTLQGIRLLGNGEGENQEVVYLVQETHSNDKPMDDDYFGVWAPSLGVGDSSPAARGLMDELCKHVVERLDEMAARSR
jgi:hypothetical protein